MADKPISAEELRALAEPLIEIPGFAPGETITVKVRRASLLRLVSEGVIPNPLLPLLYKTMASGGQWNPIKDATPEEFKQFTQAIEAVCKGILLEPSYDDVGDILTDEQRMALFAFAQSGVAPLKFFRGRPRPRAETSSDSEGVSDKTQ